MSHPITILKKARETRNDPKSRVTGPPGSEVWGAFAEIVVARKISGIVHSCALTSKGTTADGYDVFSAGRMIEVKSSQRTRGPIGDLRGKICDDIAFVETRWNDGLMEATNIYIRTSSGLAKHPGMKSFKASASKTIKLVPPVCVKL